MNSKNPFEFLVDMEHRCLSSIAGFAVTEVIDEDWVGVSFRIGDDKLIAAMNEVEEILELPEFTTVPGVKPWVVGVANVRGNLLPLMDLKSFLTNEEIKSRRKSKVIVIDFKGFHTGLVVEEVFGMKHFTKKDESTELPELHASLKSYVKKSFVVGDECWPVFNFNQIKDDDNFANASL